MKCCKIFFLFSILIILIIPLFYMESEDISKQENRTLAQFPEIKREGKINTNFFQEFETWLGDHFGTRKTLLEIYFYIWKNNNFIQNEEAFVGDEGYLFFKKGIINIPTKEEQKKQLHRAINTITKLKDKFKKEGIPLFIVLVPNRNDVLSEYWHHYFLPQNEIDYGNELVKLFKDDTDIQIIYPKRLFISENKKESIFRKDDDHVNGKGSFLLLKSVIPALKLGNLAYDVIYEKTPGPSIIAKKLGIKNTLDDTDKKLEISFKNILTSYKKAPPLSDDYDDLYEVGVSKNPYINKKLYLLGVCYTRDSLHPFLKNIFSETERITFYPYYNGPETFRKFRKSRINSIKKGDKDSLTILVLSLEFGEEWDFIEDTL